MSGRDRRVLAVELDRRVGEPVVGQGDRLHLAHRDARDPHVGLVRELGRLLERDREPVALGLQRQRAAEGDPQEQRQREARQREADRDQDPGDCRWSGLHQLQPPAALIWAVVGTPLSCWSVCRIGVLRADQGRGGARGRAVQQHEAVPQRPAGVLGEEDRVGVVVEPAEPEQVALLRGPGRVVGERVEQPVELAEALRQPLGGLVERLGRLPDVLERLLGGAREGPDLVAGSGRPCRGTGAGSGAAPGRAPAPPGAAPATPGPSSSESRLLDASAPRRRPQRPGQLLEGGADRGLLVREGAEHVVGGAHEAGQLGVAVAELLAEATEVGDHPADVAAPLLERAADLGQVAGGGREPLQRRRQLGPVLAPQALAGGLEQELEVGAGVGVERGEDLVRLDVRLRLGERDRRALLHLAAVRSPGRPRSSCPGARCAGAAAGWRRGGSAARTSVSTSMVTTARPLSSVTAVDAARP